VKPVIKWSGSKARLLPGLVRLFPDDVACFYDPFMGSGAFLGARTGAHAVGADVRPELVALLSAIRDAPQRVADAYGRRWETLQERGHTYYYDVRARFNSSGNPNDFLFLTRTCVNGLIRYNAAGEFNNSLHHGRPGMHPDRLAPLLFAWSAALAQVELICSDYRDTLAHATAGDYVVLDPPYAGTRGRYDPKTLAQDDVEELLADLNARGVRWLLTYDGRAGTREYARPIPRRLYQHRYSIPNGTSPFRRVMKLGLDDVHESVYVNYDPVPKRPSLFPEHLGDTLAAL
jgi:DNA adenine methylase